MSRKNRQYLLISAIIFIALYTMFTLLHRPVEVKPAGQSSASEVAVVTIPMAGNASYSYLEGSGLAWYGDNLVILPQYPDRFRSAGHSTLFTIPKSRLLDFLSGKNKQPITPHRLPFSENGVEAKIEDFGGYEAIAFRDHRAYLTIESGWGNNMMGHVVEGNIEPDMSMLRLNPATLRNISPQAKLSNMSDESLLIVGDKVITFYEANGAAINPTPKVHLFDADLQPLGTLPMDNIEYRITDVTAPDAGGRFWAINYLYPGDRAKLKPATDEIAAKYGRGPTHAKFVTVERLVQFRYTAHGIHLTAVPPVQLRLIDDDHARNWEGIVRLDDKGFLLITDKYPETILGFVPAKP